MPTVWQGAKPILQQDLIGNRQNYYPDKQPGFIIGRATATVQNVWKDLWDGPTANYVFPVAAQQMRVVSTSAADASAGTGVQKVVIDYLDTNYNIGQEVVTLNGVTPVNTVATNILRINGFHSSQVGTGGVAAGNISLTNTAGTVTYGYIVLGENLAMQAVFTIPAGMVGYANHWQASSGSAAGGHFCQINFQATSHNGVLVPGAFLSQDIIAGQNLGYAVNFPIPITIPATADVKVSAISDAGAANVTAVAAVMGWYEPAPGV